MRVKGEGPIPSRVMLIGEGSGKAETATGRPFVQTAPAGAELTRYLNGYDLPTRDQVFITNLVKEWAGGAATKKGEVTQADVERDGWELQIELSLVQPKVVVTLGKWSTQWFLGSDVTMESVHGLLFKQFRCSDCGRVMYLDFPVSDHLCSYPVWEACYVLPVYHPAAGLHQPELAARTAYDFAQLAGVLKTSEGKWGGLCWTPRPAGHYAEYCEFESQQTGHAGHEYGLDTEGTPTNPWGLSLSVKAGEGTVKRWGQPYDDEGGPPLLPQNLPKTSWILHNAMWDLKVLDAMGIAIPEERFHDTQVMAYLLGVEPQGLKALAHRHLGLSMKDYEEVVGEWVTEYTKAGKPKKKKKLVLKSLDEIPLQTAIDYAGADADATRQLKPILWNRVRALGLEEIYEVDRRVLPMYSRMEQVGLPIDLSHMAEFSKWLGDEIEVRTWALQSEWPGLNPGSPDQVAAIMFDHLKLPGGKKTPSGKRYSTNDKIMEALKDLHPFVATIIEWRELSKTKGTFVDPISQYVHAGRLHYQLLPTRVVSGRLAAKNPNVLAFPKHTELGHRFRAGIVAPPGRLLGSWDLNQIELRVLALDSGSATLRSAFLTGEDLHSKTARRIFNLPPGVKESGPQRVAAKATNFGIPMGLTEIGLAEQMRKHHYSFPELEWVVFNGVADRRQAEADICRAWIAAVIDDWGLEPYIKEKHAEARRYGYVRSRGGRIRFLPSVLSPNKHIREGALRDAQAYGPQAGARYLMKQIEYQVWVSVIKPLQVEGVYVEPLLDVHDDLLLEFEVGVADVVVPVVDSIFNSAFPDLGIPITAKSSVGQCWADL